MKRGLCSSGSSSSPPSTLLLLGLLLLQASLGLCIYFESDLRCGYDSSAFYQLRATPELQQELSMGVCDWGFKDFPELGGEVGQCLQCSFIPADVPEEEIVCPDGFTIVDNQVLNLAPISQCQWSQGCMDMACPNGTVEAESAVCGSSNSMARRCCTLRPYYRCCRYRQCIMRAQPAGKCSTMDRDLLPGQTITSMVYAVPTATDSCAPYAFPITRTCQTDRTFASDHYFDSCTLAQPRRDAQGCQVVPGYTFVPGQLYGDPNEAVINDFTRWSDISQEAVAKAAADPVLMAGRCSNHPACSGFDNGGSLSLRSYVPFRGLKAAGSACEGIYVRDVSLHTCTRIAGYLFTPMMTVGSPERLCSQCSNNTLLALRCSAQDVCTGFSTAHGLISDPVGATAANRYAYTGTPCRGLYAKVGAGLDLPAEVETLDRMLCGDSSYCTVPLQYEAAIVGLSGSTSYGVAINVTVTSDLTLPRLWTGVGPSTGGSSAVSSLPSVLGLMIECRNNSRILSDLPQQLPQVFPNLQALGIVNCGVQGSLPASWSSLTSLLLLDLSNNALTGGLPPAWGSALRLGYLSLAFNELTGTVPEEWADMMVPADSDLLSGSSIVVAGAAAGSSTATSTWGNGTSGSSSSAAASWGSSAISSQARTLLADLSYNRLAGSLPRSFVAGACLDRAMRLEFSPWQGGSGQLRSTLEGLGSVPYFVFYGNYLLQQWAGYQYAAGKSTYSAQDHDDNMCGAYKYLIAIGLVWGAFGIALLSVIAWRVAKWARQRAELRRKLQPLTQAPRSRQPSDTSDGSSDHDQDLDQDPHLQIQGDRAEGDMAAADPDDPRVRALNEQAGPIQVMPKAKPEAATAADISKEGAEDGAAKAAAEPGGVDTQGISLLFDTLWAKRWVRRCVLLLRLAYLTADVALDAACTWWLWQDGYSTAEAIVATVFLLLPQVVITVVVFYTLVPNVFGNCCSVMLLGPVLLAVTPGLGPIMAAWNLFNPDIPLVFWRYLELVEFSVALLEAPAQSITQSIIYARNNQMANGMYINHGLFIASIVLSLGDMIVVAFKLLRYKHGWARRIWIAFTHLDKQRDMAPSSYRQGREDELMYYKMDGEPPSAPTVGLVMDGDDAGGHDGQDGKAQQIMLGGGSSSFKNPLLPAGSPRSAANDGRALRGQDSIGRGSQAQARPLSAADSVGSTIASGLSSQYKSSPVGAARYRPSLMQQSSVRLASLLPPSPLAPGKLVDLSGGLHAIHWQRSNSEALTSTVQGSEADNLPPSSRGTRSRIQSANAAASAARQGGSSVSSVMLAELPGGGTRRTSAPPPGLARLVVNATPSAAAVSDTLKPALSPLAKPPRPPKLIVPMSSGMAPLQVNADRASPSFASAASTAFAAAMAQAAHSPFGPGHERTSLTTVRSASPLGKSSSLGAAGASAQDRLAAALQAVVAATERVSGSGPGSIDGSVGAGSRASSSSLSRARSSHVSPLKEPRRLPERTGSSRISPAGSMHAAGTPTAASQITSVVPMPVRVQPRTSAPSGGAPSMSMSVTMGVADVSASNPVFGFSRTSPSPQAEQQQSTHSSPRIKRAFMVAGAGGAGMGEITPLPPTDSADLPQANNYGPRASTAPAAGGWVASASGGSRGGTPQRPLTAMEARRTRGSQLYAGLGDPVDERDLDVQGLEEDESGGGAPAHPAPAHHMAWQGEGRRVAGGSVPAAGTSRTEVQALQPLQSQPSWDMGQGRPDRTPSAGTAGSSRFAPMPSGAPKR